jgi:prolyl oligopeptidase
MKRLLFALLASTSLMTITPTIAAEPDKPAAEARTPLSELGKNDPYLWMEEIEGTRAMDWAKAQNAKSLPVLQGDARYADLEAKALAILNAKDRVPGVSFAGDGSLRNFWQDKDHVRGVWRKTTLESYRTAEPAWETILDVDALSKAEDANWVFKGASCLPPDDTRCLVTLSNGGKDAVTVREFDTATKSFVDGGFALPEGKQNYTWLDEETLLVGREWKPGELTKSGYAYGDRAVPRRRHRRFGQPVRAAGRRRQGRGGDGLQGRHLLRERGLPDRGRQAGEAGPAAEELDPGLCRRPDGRADGAGLAGEGFQDRRPDQL